MYSKHYIFHKFQFDILRKSMKLRFWKNSKKLWKKCSLLKKQKYRRDILNYRTFREEWECQHERLYCDLEEEIRFLFLVFKNNTWELWRCSVVLSTVSYHWDLSSNSPHRSIEAKKCNKFLENFDLDKHLKQLCSIVSVLARNWMRQLRRGLSTLCSLRSRGTCQWH